MTTSGNTPAPTKITPEYEAALRQTLLTIGPLAVEAVTSQGTPEEVLGKELAAEFKDWTTFTQGATSAEAFEKRIKEIDAPRLVQEATLAARILDNFPQYQRTAQSLMERNLYPSMQLPEGIINMGRKNNIRQVTIPVGEEENTD